jgi:hypothetical protein
VTVAQYPPDRYSTHPLLTDPTFSGSAAAAALARPSFTSDKIMELAAT